MEAFILIGLGALLLFIGFLLQRIEKKHGVDRKAAPVKKIERWVGWILVTSLIVLILLSINEVTINYINVLLFFGIVALFQAVLEWGYVRNTQRSVISLVLNLVFVLSLVGLVEVVKWTLANF
ncbi:hypothetical protein AUO94_01810 [Planococcus kocurii]|uniref:DUF4181 domain-containing protein n=1 Tax=Planococcus kocurii TaxID=1374 RepID=A0ABN4JRA8_9BACL|nr:DUF4181 domain-containing protein [Planococcus kocurii]ALS77452.1 hypothetical protein AUO94_01810 [Planococcus kocurii]